MNCYTPPVNELSEIAGPALDQELGTANLAALYPSLQGEGPLVGQAHLFLRLVGCNMRCGYCDAPETLKPKAFFDVGVPHTQHLPNPVDLGSLLPLMAAEMAGKDISAIAITGGEPLLQCQALESLLPQIASRWQLPILLETNGLLPRQFSKVSQWVDIVSADLKLVSVDQSAPKEGRTKALIQTLAGAKEGATVYIKVVISEQADMAELKNAAAEVLAAFPKIPWFIQPLTRDGKPIVHPIVQEAESVLKNLGAFVSIQTQWHIEQGLP